MGDMTKDNVTAASRVMLPTYSILFGTIGLLLVFQDSERTANQAFAVARSFFEPFALGPLSSMQMWGIAFLAVALVEAGALIRKCRRTYMYALVVGAWLAAFWAILILAAALTDIHVSFTSAVWVGGWIAAHVASVRSLATGER